MRWSKIFGFHRCASCRQYVIWVEFVGPCHTVRCLLLLEKFKFCTCHSLYSRQSIKGWKLIRCRPRLHIETGFYHSSIPVVPRVLGRPVGLPVGLPVWLPVELPVERPVEIPVGLPVERAIDRVGLTASHTTFEWLARFWRDYIVVFPFIA